MARTIPCLDVTFPAGMPDLPDRVALALDGLAPAAIHEVEDGPTPLWRVFLADPAGVGRAAKLLRAAFDGEGLRIERAEVPDQDWAARSQAHLTHVTVGGITVAPPWDVPAPTDSAVVVIHPSTGFGTGHHQTTRLCLALLQSVSPAGRHVVDLGTGSGVLALAAWRLGAASVEAIDYDQDSLANARENLGLNEAEGAIVLRHADLRVEQVAPADVVLANLTGALLVAQSPALIALVRPGGTLIVSGFLAPELDAIRAVFEPALGPGHEAAEDQWRALRFLRA